MLGLDSSSSQHQLKSITLSRSTIGSEHRNVLPRALSAVVGIGHTLSPSSAARLLAMLMNDTGERRQLA